jgi:predicted secreted hydrolase
MQGKPTGKIHAALILFILTVSVVALFTGCRDDSHNGVEPSVQLFLLPFEEDLSGFARATQPGKIEFPRDRGAHDAYQTEWWYYTGNLSTKEGRRFGFQLTFFRRALTPPPAAGDHRASESAWRTNQVYMAHFAISDIDNDRFYHSEKFSRGAVGLAGAQADPYRVWLENWHARETAPGVVRLFARTDDAEIDLVLTQKMPPVLHGNRGLSPKGPEEGNASYYYSIVRQETKGTITVQGQVHEVSGLSWKDHEYSTSALSPGAVGWDWFSLQFDDGTAMMFFQIRRADGTLEEASSGSFIHADGSVQHLGREDWELTVKETWNSPDSGADYPSRWHLEINALDLVLSGASLMANQELTVSPTYWEGAVAFNGTRYGRSVNAQGYVEMTGYAETMAGRI